MMFGSLPNRNCQTRWLITASASAREASSAGVKPRPSGRRDTDRREVVARHVHRRHGDRGALVRGLKEAFAAAPAGDRPGRRCRGRRGSPGRTRCRSWRRPPAPAVGRSGGSRVPPIHPSFTPGGVPSTMRMNRRMSDDDAHPEAEGGDADGREGTRANERARRMTEVVHVSDHGSSIRGRAASRSAASPAVGASGRWPIISSQAGRRARRTPNVENWPDRGRSAAANDGPPRPSRTTRYPSRISAGLPAISPHSSWPSVRSGRSRPSLLPCRSGSSKPEGE